MFRRRCSLSGTSPRKATRCGTSAAVEVEREDASILRKEFYGSLTPSEREYMRMKEAGNCTLDEMSASTGKDKSVIKALLSKARRKMKEILKER